MSISKYFAVILFSLLISATAFAIPGIPHQFYGFVTVNGAPADGASIVAEVNGIETSTTTINGNYGFNPSIFYVTDPNGNNSGKTIEFFLNGSSVATHIFENAGYTELNLSLGVAPFCGDGSCSGGETCSTCEADCGACDTGGPSLSTGTGPSGGSSNALTVKIEGTCVGQPTVVTTLNTVGNPARNASVIVTFDGATVAEGKTDDDGKISFTFEEEGEYKFYVTKSYYTQSTKTIELSECIGGEEAGTATGDGEEGTTGVNLCENVDCDDQNPCTAEFCIPTTGHCAYENQQDGVACGIQGTCQKGVCAEPVEERGGEQAGPTGFFGLGTGQAAGAGVVVVALIALLSYLFAAGKRKKKK